MFSSGTTGTPKCIVHGAGGALLEHLKEHQLHTDFREGDRVFYFTTCGWMMWNWLVSALASGAVIVLYDGAPMPLHAPECALDARGRGTRDRVRHERQISGDVRKSGTAPISHARPRRASGDSFHRQSAGRGRL